MGPSKTSTALCEPTASFGGFDEAQGESAQQFDVPVGSDGKPQTPVAFDDTRHVFLNHQNLPQ
jgi:hypothetical protein